MTPLKTEFAKRELLRRVRRQRLRNITVLPSLITLLNGLCGFAAIAFASKGAAADTERFFFQKPQLTYFAISGYMIFFAMLADMLDGRLARMSQNTSSFGGQLDSLCDMISFGVAPAFLMLKVLEYKLVGIAEPNPAFVGFPGKFIWGTAAVYMSCAAIRLARFNVENEEDESKHMSFMGLPTPAAGGVIGSLIIFHQDMLPQLARQNSWPYQVSEMAIIYSLPFIILGLSLLMISRIRYPHIVNQYIRGRKPFAHLIRVLAFLVLIIWNLQAALVLIFCGFAASGFLKWFYFKVIAKKSTKFVSRRPVLMVTNPPDAASQGDMTE
jgi:CDP-diacylglycerol--serine O-phosphatidyltransferase